MEKEFVRKQFLDYRRQLDLSTCSKLSQQVQQQLIDSEPFVCAQSLALYSPINNEVATEQIFKVARKQNKQVYYPRVVGDELEFLEVSAVKGLVMGTFGIAEPEIGEKIPVAELDLLIVPGVAFDVRGYRLGYGGGFYDRQLIGKSAKVISVGLCFDTQLCDLLPTEEHDQALDYIATETKFIPCHI